MKRETPAQVFSFKIYKISENTFLTVHLRVSASESGNENMEACLNVAIYNL